MMRRAPDRMAEALRIRSEKVKYQWKKGPTNRALLLLLAERTGLEPATPDVTGRYSNQLNYHSVFDR
jgi:hypothetical protein